MLECYDITSVINTTKLRTNIFSYKICLSTYFAFLGFEFIYDMNPCTSSKSLISVFGHISSDSLSISEILRLCFYNYLIVIISGWDWNLN